MKMKVNVGEGASNSGEDKLEIADYAFSEESIPSLLEQSLRGQIRIPPNIMWRLNKTWY